MAWCASKCEGWRAEAGREERGKKTRFQKTVFPPKTGFCKCCKLGYDNTVARVANEKNPCTVLEAVSISSLFEQIMIRGPQATVMRRSWRQSPSRANHRLENHSNVYEVTATACDAVPIISYRATLPRNVTRTQKMQACHPKKCKKFCTAQPAHTSRQLVPVNLVSAVGTSVT